MRRASRATRSGFFKLQRAAAISRSSRMTGLQPVALRRSAARRTRTVHALRTAHVWRGLHHPQTPAWPPSQDSPWCGFWKEITAPIATNCVSSFARRWLSGFFSATRRRAHALEGLHQRIRQFAVPTRAGLTVFIFAQHHAEVCGVPTALDSGT